MSTLIYVGANVGLSLIKFIHKFSEIYVFEPDPEMFEELANKYGEYNHINLVNAACSIENGTAKFWVTPNRVSSSLGDVNEEPTHPQIPFKVIDVNTIVLSEYLEENGVDEIDLYYSDAQGSDLNILKTMKSYVDDKKIKELYVETHGNDIMLYEGLDNQFDGFKELLSENYTFACASLGRLGGKKVLEKDIPKGEREWDSSWIRK